MKCLKFVQLFGLMGAFLLILAQDAYAYLDMGTGSYIFQMLVAVFIGGFYAIKVYWAKIRTFFSKDKEVQDDSE